MPRRVLLDPAYVYYCRAKGYTDKQIVSHKNKQAKADGDSISFYIHKSNKAPVPFKRTYKRTYKRYGGY